MSKLVLEQAPGSAAYLPAAQGAHRTVPAQHINTERLYKIKMIFDRTHSSLIQLISNLMRCSVVIKLWPKPGNKSTLRNTELSTCRTGDILASVHNCIAMYQTVFPEALADVMKSFHIGGVSITIQMSTST